MIVLDVTVVNVALPSIGRLAGRPLYAARRPRVLMRPRPLSRGRRLKVSRRTSHDGAGAWSAGAPIVTEAYTPTSLGVTPA